jgi:hypothetical protein
VTTLLTLLSVALGGVIGLAGSWLIEWMKEALAIENDAQIQNSSGAMVRSTVVCT